MEIMKFHNRSTSIVAFFVFLFASIALSSCEGMSSPGPQPDKTFTQDVLEFSVSLNKGSYQIGEPIELTFNLRNIGEDLLIVNGRFALNKRSAPQEYRDIYCVVMGPSGQPINFGASVFTRDLRDTDFIRLQVNDMIESPSFNLQDLYSFDGYGEYTIEAIYENQLDPDNGLVSWKGSLVSNKVTFTIVP